MGFIYNLGILIYVLLAKVLSPFNSKARLWTSGRKNWEELLKKSVSPGDKNIWIHCASLGEFEQGRPVIELFRKEKPGFKIVLTFFSSSGYEIRKNYGLADYVCYLPADTPGNSKKFISILNPALVIFVKYEFWNNYISAISAEKIPLYLISGIFRPEQPFFKWYGVFFRRMLFRFSHIFVQDEQSCSLLARIGIDDLTKAGDTRFDRVVRIAETARDIPQIEIFRDGEKILLAGSSWQQDEEIIARYINRYPDNMKWVFAPHELISPISRLEKLFTVKVVRFRNSAKSLLMPG
jgi:3-deoxy-D-manno-octulosonic-acid transferase